MNNVDPKFAEMQVAAANSLMLEMRDKCVQYRKKLREIAHAMDTIGEQYWECEPDSDRAQKIKQDILGYLELGTSLEPLLVLEGTRIYDYNRYGVLGLKSESLTAQPMGEIQKLADRRLKLVVYIYEEPE